ncbi:MAG: RES family NAD+ phosphorylase [Phycisphaeraceae bacterium]|nr:RES family NAD+ phosphorylase [Phycisphaeraceae bacterium]
MKIHAWRIIKSKHAAKAFTGIGAKTYGGRWNSPGTAVIYTAGGVSLAILEMLVHLQNQVLMHRYVIFEVVFDASLVTTLNPAKLPKAWRKSPSPPTVQQMGDNWIVAGNSAVLRVPSAIVPEESNYLLNPEHPDYARIVIGLKKPIRLDPRLVSSPTSITF